MDNPLVLEVDEEYSPIARLIELGRQKKYVTIDDILHFFPEAEKDIEQLEEAFSALLSAGVAFAEDAPDSEAPENELVAVEEAKARTEPGLDDYLSNIDTTDGIGIYLKEASQVPLLTATARFLPIYLAKACSNSPSFGPSERFGLLSTSVTA